MDIMGICMFEWPVCITGKSFTNCNDKKILSVIKTTHTVIYVSSVFLAY